MLVNLAEMLIEHSFYYCFMRLVITKKAHEFSVVITEDESGGYIAVVPELLVAALRATA